MADWTILDDVSGVRRSEITNGLVRLSVSGKVCGGRWVAGQQRRGKGRAWFMPRDVLEVGNVTENAKKCSKFDSRMREKSRE